MADLIEQGLDYNLFDNLNGTYNLISSSNLNYLSNGIYVPVEEAYLQEVAPNKWSNVSDEFLCTIDNGEISTPQGNWKILGFYIGETLIGNIDFNNYNKFGTIIQFKTPWGYVEYNLKPFSYTENIVFEKNPFEGLLISGDKLIINYSNSLPDLEVWAKDINNYKFNVIIENNAKVLNKEYFYQAKYPLTIDPSFSVAQDRTYTEDVRGKYLDYSNQQDLYAGYYANIEAMDTTPNGSYTAYGLITSKSHAFFRFNLSSIPSDATVTAATGYYHLINGQAYSAINVFGSNYNYSLDSLTLTEAQNIVNEPKSNLGTISTTGTNTWKSITGINFVNYINSKKASYPLIVFNENTSHTNPWYQTTWHSLEYGSGTYAAYLDITYSTTTATNYYVQQKSNYYRRRRSI